MTCKTCGEKPKKDRHFPSAVVEINNPESLALLRKVVISASLGDDTTVPPVIGKYRNVVLQYEANDHIYLYSSDGIPTFIKTAVPQEVLDRITTLEADVTTLESGLETETGARERADGVLQQEIDDLKNSPDVVDIVATYADLMAYDTSSLGDKDVIRVLADETHEGQSDYYRWSITTETWTFIGTVGNYYTKDQIDSLLDEKQDELTPGENISIVDESGALVISAQDTTYTAGYGLELNGTEFSVDSSVVQDTLVAGDNITIEDESGSLVISATDTTYTFDSTPTAGSTNPVTSEGIKSYVDTKSVTFKPFPASVVTTGTTQQFMDSILALHPETGMAYLGTVSLSDMPAGLLQEEVEVYVYSDYVVYCVMRSTDVSPYAWWCASYNYQGWRPINTDTTYTAGTNVSISSGNVISATDTTYSAGPGLTLTSTTFSVDTTTIPTQSELTAALADKQDILTAGDNITIADESGDLVISATDTTYTAGTGIAINNGVISATSTGPTVVQTTGTSTTDVMSQNAVTNMVAPKGSTDAIWVNNPKQGYTFPSSLSAYSVTLNASNTAGGARAISAIAINGTASGHSAISIGVTSSATQRGSIALGRGASATSVGEMNIGTDDTTAGYNSSNYRLLSGVYDGQSAHDAATKGQLDAAVNTIDTALDAKQDELTPGTGISITEESGALVISATGAAIATINAQDWSNLWQ